MGLLNFLRNIFKPKPKMLPEAKVDIDNTFDFIQSQGLPFTYKADNNLSNKEQGNNPQLETILINKLKKEKLYQIREEKDATNNSTTFYHIFKNESSIADTSLYISCKQKNIAMIVDEILSTMKNDDIYLKFRANQYIDESLDNKFIVIYALNENVAKILDVINNISDKKPDLFEESDITNSCLEKVTSFVHKDIMTA